MSDITKVKYFDPIPGYEGLKIPVEINHFDILNLDWITDIFLLGMEALIYDEDEDILDLFDWLNLKIFPFIPSPAHLLEIAWGFGVLSSVDTSKMYYQTLDNKNQTLDLASALEGLDLGEE